MDAEAQSIPSEVKGSSSFSQASFNCVSLLLGLGMLACPYAIEQAGWSVFFTGLAGIPAVYFYTALLLKRCLERYPEVQSFEDLSEKALGRKGWRVFTTVFFVEVYATLVSYGVSIADNLQEIMARKVQQQDSALHNRWLLTALAALAVLPTVWLRNLRALSVMSVGSIISIAVVIVTLVWLAVSHEVDFSGSQGLVAARPAWLPVSTSIFLFNYSGHVVLPNIYISMQDKSKFTWAITLSFCIATICFGGLGLLGALMFGDAIKSQVTLNLPTQYIASMVALWLSVIVPITKFALFLSPLFVSFEIALPWSSKTKKHVIVSLFARSCCTISIFLVALVFPFFSYVLALIGATLSVSLCVIFPCIFYLKLMGQSLSRLHKYICIGLIVVAAMVGVTCTTFSVRNYVVDHKIN